MMMYFVTIQSVCEPYRGCMNDVLVDYLPCLSVGCRRKEYDAVPYRDGGCCRLSGWIEWLVAGLLVYQV